MLLLEKIPSFLLVSFGAIIGVNIRFFIYNKLHQLKFRKDFIILFINSLASFLFGLFHSISLNSNSFNYLDQFSLFFFIGCLGSLSTFSTFMYDLFETFKQLKFFRTFKLFVFSLISGITCLAFGFILGS